MQDTVPAGSFLKAITPELADVLAQAAESPFAPPTFYVVARYDPVASGTLIRPFDVQRPVATYAEAEALANQLGDPGVYGVFGPFLNDAGPSSSEDRTVVEQLLVTPQGGEVAATPFPIPGRSFDALFYGEEAVEQVVVPYYVRVYGAEFGVQVLQSFREAPLALVGHLPWSEEVAAAPDSLQPVAEVRSRLVTFHRDESGEVQWKPVHSSSGDAGGSGVRPAKQETVARFMVTPQDGSAPEAPFEIPGSTFVALLYSLQAVEKFVIPYCAQEYGAEFGVDVLKRFRDAPLALMAYIAWPEEVTAAVSCPWDDGPDAGSLTRTRTRLVPALIRQNGHGTMKYEPLLPPAPGQE